VDYCRYVKGPSDLPFVEKKVTVKGGTGIRAEHNGKDNGVTTPRGVLTEVNDEDLALLEENPVFKMHKENGFIIVVKEPRKTIEKATLEMEKVVADMKPKDKSAQKIKEDFDVQGPKPIDKK